MHTQKVETGMMVQEKDWIAHEVGRAQFEEKRLKKRFSALLAQLSEDIGCSIPLACQDRVGPRVSARGRLK
jgi:hypothetical protein